MTGVQTCALPISYAVITVALVLYEAKKRKAKSAAGAQLAAEQAAEEEA